MSRWLITGATGLLGSNALVKIAQTDEVVGAARRKPRRSSAKIRFEEVNLAAPAERASLIARVGVEHVLHAAAVATIEGCEADPSGAYELNVRAAEDLAAQAYAEGARFIFVSTDAVFDGVAGNYSEQAPTSPISEYGRGKAEAEQRVLAVNPDAIVARVNFFGWSPGGSRSLAEFFYNRLASGVDVGGFTDVRVSTTYVDHLIGMLYDLAATEATGIFHVATREGASKYEFGRALATEFGFDPAQVVPALSTEVLKNPRGSDLRLRTDKLSTVLGRQLPTTLDGLIDLRRDRELGRTQQLTNLQPRSEQ